MHIYELRIRSSVCRPESVARMGFLFLKAMQWVRAACGSSRFGMSGDGLHILYCHNLVSGVPRVIARMAIAPRGPGGVLDQQRSNRKPPLKKKLHFVASALEEILEQIKDMQQDSHTLWSILLV